ncbi:Lipoprotein-releasing system ATP-binding protein LolD [Candidatus Bealeia paramacronuclearis]|uniref:Lipoprotein-releasing system ATP-binding protein LolD n=1 Tax=Candidatus Bealeia paramacronuclearis TaxID=1921001 RepID=A0ABZ2C6B0_9PROT|nr:Lipoprotein-releasing system ATP-binding protein LolD [Candidatus Bealeia paramacronuclearis]
MSKKPALVLKGIQRTFLQAVETLEIIRGANLELFPGEIVALIGPSGSGKSTLLQTIGLLEHAQGGEILIEGKDCTKLDDQGRTLVRRQKLGFVYQFHHLLPEFSALENVVIPQMINGKSKSDAEVRAKSLLTSVGLEHRLTHRPARLSGGEQQRVAIVRALANSPAILLADEPTGNLDEKTANAVFQELIKLVREQNLAALIATHNTDLAAQMDRTVTLHEGQLVESIKKP